MASDQVVCTAGVVCHGTSGLITPACNNAALPILRDVVATYPCEGGGALDLVVLFVEVEPAPVVTVQDMVMCGERHVIHVHKVEDDVRRAPPPRVPAGRCGGARSAHGQHTVSTRSAHGQHTVSTWPAHGQRSVYHHVDLRPGQGAKVYES